MQIHITEPYLTLLHFDIMGGGEGDDASSLQLSVLILKSSVPLLRGWTVERQDI